MAAKEVICSVVIPLYNKAELIAKTLKSISEQTFCDYEVVIVDDGSTDGSAEIAKSVSAKLGFKKYRIIQQENGGVGMARNRGIAEARGVYIAFLDADDEWYPHHLETLMTLTSNFKQCNVFATNYCNLMADGKKTINKIHQCTFEEESGEINNYFEIAAKSHPPLWTSAVMVQRKALMSIGGFPIGVKSGEDLLTWARLAVKYRIAYCKTPSAIYNRGYSNPRPPEINDQIGKQLELLYGANRTTIGLRKYLAAWYNMRMSRCLAHRMYIEALQALCKSIWYKPTLRIAKPLLIYFLLGLQKK